jgi:hypothetical protein
VIFGSAALLLNGIDLEREIGDLDIFLSEQDWREIKAKIERFAPDDKKYQIAFKAKLEAPEEQIGRIVLYGGKVELLCEFPGVAFSEVFARSQIMPDSSGLRVAHKQDLIAWKQAQGGDKSKSDLAKIMNSAIQAKSNS